VKYRLRLPRPARSWRGQRGQTLVIMAFLSVFLITLLGLVVDSVRLYILTAQAERDAEASALAGALYMPNYYNTPAPAPDNQDAVMRVCQVAQQNGITNCPATSGQVGAMPSTVSGNIYELQVTVTLQADVFFLDFVSPNLATATISRSAVAQFLPPIALGSRSAAFGDESPQDTAANGGTPVQSFWARLNGPYALQENGDAFTPNWQEGPTDPIAYPDGGSHSFSRWSGTVCCTNHQQWPEPITNPDQHPAGFTGANGVLGYNYEIVVPPGAGNVTVQIFNPAFDPQKANGAVGVDDLGSACSDPAFNTGGCKTDQENEYLQLSYSIYSAPLLFERAPDTLKASTSFPSLDNIPADNSAHACSGATPYWDPQKQECVADPGYIEKWYPFYTITQPGTYRLAVEATGYYGEHEYGIKLTDSSSVTTASTALPATDGPRIWAWNDMCVYFTVAGGGNTTFDLGEIPAAYAGKTLNFSLFDPGDGGGSIGIEILDPSGNPVPLPAWVKTVAGSGGTEINATGGTYNGLWLHLPITIPATYSASPGNDWWQVEYLTGPGATPNDTITISISLSGSPIHLVSEVF
jgi:Flp pilus assembly protein TadG